MQRLAEVRDSSSVLSSSQLQSAPAHIQLDWRQVQEMLDSVQLMLQQLTSHQMQEFFLIHSSPK